jgi:preprotein translocase subunit SecE
MNREMRRLMEREERRQKKQDPGTGVAKRAPGAVAPTRQPAAERKPLWARLIAYLREVRQELKKVSWPSREQMIAFTTVTLITTVILTLVVFGLDVVMKESVLMLVGRG